MNWTKFDEISKNEFYLYTEDETGAKIYNDTKIENARESWSAQEITLTNSDILEIVESYQKETFEERQIFIERLKEKVNKLTAKINKIKI